jgi:organic hydroperoxide reductase OsmC/OhrA
VEVLQETAVTRTEISPPAVQTRRRADPLDAHVAPGLDGVPEQEFATAWSACLAESMQRAARALQIALPAGTVVATEVGESGDDRVVHLNVSLPGLSRGAAAAVVEAAHELCPHSRAARGAVDVAIDLN